MTSRWKAHIRLRMMISQTGVTIAAVLLLEMLCACVAFLIISLTTGHDENFTNFVAGFLPIALIILLISIPAGALFSLISTRGIIDRMQRLVDVTALIAAGHYEQRLQTGDEYGEDMVELFEQQFNVVATQLMESIEQRHALAEQNARLAERSRILRDLHDSVKQQAFALTMQISTALTLFDTQPASARTHLQHSEVLAYQVQQELTALIHSSRPSALNDKGFATALQEYTAMWSRQQEIPIKQHIDTCSLPPSMEEALLRIAQEALSNIARHSGATVVTFDLSCEPDAVTLSIKDNGCGFATDDAALSQKNGVGLRSMQERIAAFHGTLQIVSGHGTGTRIVARCPYPTFSASQTQTASSAPLLTNTEVI